MPVIKINGVEMDQDCFDFILKHFKIRTESLSSCKTRSAVFQRYICVSLHNLNLLMYHMGDDGPKNELAIPPSRDENKKNKLADSRFWQYTSQDDTKLYCRNGVVHDDVNYKKPKHSIEIDDFVLGSVLNDAFVVTVINAFVIRADVDSLIYDLTNPELTPYYPVLYSLHPEVKELVKQQDAYSLQLPRN